MGYYIYHTLINVSEEEIFTLKCCDFYLYLGTSFFFFLKMKALGENNTMQDEVYFHHIST